LILLGFVSVLTGKCFLTPRKSVILKCQEPVTWWFSVIS